MNEEDKREAARVDVGGSNAIAPGSANELEDLSAGFQELTAANGVFLSTLAESIWSGTRFPLDKLTVMLFLAEFQQELTHSVQALNASPTPLPPRAEEYLWSTYWVFRDSLIRQSLDTPQ